MKKFYPYYWSLLKQTYYWTQWTRSNFGETTHFHEYFDQEIKIMLSVLAVISRSRVSKIPRGPRWQIGPNLPTLLKRPLITRAIESTPFIVQQQLQVNRVHFPGPSGHLVGQ